MNARLVPQADLSPRREAELRRLLVAAYPKHADVFTGASYWGSRPEQRLWLADGAGQIVAQLGFGRRHIRVGAQALLIAGIGAVAVHPDWQGQGLGRQLLAELQAILRVPVPVDFGFLQCRAEVVGFDERAGLVRVPQAVRYLDPDQRAWVTDNGPALMLPAVQAMVDWPEGGEIDLRGLPW